MQQIVAIMQQLHHLFYIMYIMRIKLWGVLMKGTPSRTQLGGIARTHLIQSDNQNKGGFIYKPKQIRL